MCTRLSLQVKVQAEKAIKFCVASWASAYTKNWITNFSYPGISMSIWYRNTYVVKMVSSMLNKICKTHEEWLNI